MISLSKLLFETESYGDTLRYGRDAGATRHGTHGDHGPVVVWNCTRACNLSCKHCYCSATGGPAPNELSTAEAEAFIDDLAAYRVPVLLLSGGEPTLRADLPELIRRARGHGIRCTISTNGTLISRERAAEYRELGVSYIGISLDGIGARNDRFRGRRGAFEDALAGIRNCKAEGQKVGLRFTMSRDNLEDLDRIFALVEREDIPRICFYHLVYAGRGAEMTADAPSHAETRAALDRIIEWCRRMAETGQAREVLTVDNHCDGVYLYHKLRASDPERAERVLELLRRSGGNRSGVAIGRVDWLGNVHADQFTPNHTFGNLRETPFSRIWSEAAHPILAGLRDRRALLGGRCADCAYLDVCNGNLRARAESVHGDFWAPDPACYLDYETELRG